MSVSRGLSPLTEEVLQAFLCNSYRLPVGAGVVFSEISGALGHDRQVFDAMVSFLVEEGYLREVWGGTIYRTLAFDRGLRRWNGQRTDGALWNGVYWKR